MLAVVIAVLVGCYTREAFLDDYAHASCEWENFCIVEPQGTYTDEEFDACEAAYRERAETQYTAECWDADAAARCVSETRDVACDGSESTSSCLELVCE